MRERELVLLVTTVPNHTKMNLIFLHVVGFDWGYLVDCLLSYQEYCFQKCTLHSISFRILWEPTVGHKSTWEVSVKRYSQRTKNWNNSGNNVGTCPRSNSRGRVMVALSSNEQTTAFVGALHFYPFIPSPGPCAPWVSLTTTSKARAKPNCANPKEKSLPKQKRAKICPIFDYVDNAKHP